MPHVEHFEKVKDALLARVERSWLDTKAKTRMLEQMRADFKTMRASTSRLLVSATTW